MFRERASPCRDGLRARAGRGPGGGCDPFRVASFHRPLSLWSLGVGGLEERDPALHGGGPGPGRLRLFGELHQRTRTAVPRVEHGLPCAPCFGEGRLRGCSRLCQSFGLVFRGPLKVDGAVEQCRAGLVVDDFPRIPRPDGEGRLCGEPPRVWFPEHAACAA